MRKTLSVGNLPADLNPAVIARLFSQVGTVLHAELITPIGSPASRHSAPRYVATQRNGLSVRSATLAACY